MRPSNSKESVKGTLLVTLTNDLTSETMLNRPNSIGNSLSPAAASSTTSPDLSQVLQNKINSSESVSYDEHGALPQGWVRNFDQFGRPYYIDHNSRTTSWKRPTVGTDSTIPPATALGIDQQGELDRQRAQFEQRNAATPTQNDLPQGWERRMAPSGLYYYIDHNDYFLYYSIYCCDYFTIIVIIIII